MIQGKDKGSWNKEIPFSIVSTIISQWRLQKGFEGRQKQKGLETAQKMKCLSIFF